MQVSKTLNFSKVKWVQKIKFVLWLESRKISWIIESFWLTWDFNVFEELREHKFFVLFKVFYCFPENFSHFHEAKIKVLIFFIVPRHANFKSDFQWKMLTKWNFLSLFKVHKMASDVGNYTIKKRKSLNLFFISPFHSAEKSRNIQNVMSTS